MGTKPSAFTVVTSLDGDEGVPLIDDLDGTPTNVIADLQLVSSLGLLAQTVLAATAASITFSSIPATYETLQLVFSGRSDRAGQAADLVSLRFNGDTAANYDYQSLAGSASTASALEIFAATAIRAFRVPAATATASRPGIAQVAVPGYARTTFNKLVTSTYSDAEGTATGTLQVGMYMGVWRSTSAITSITLLPEFGTNFIAGTVATLYGLRGA